MMRKSLLTIALLTAARTLAVPQANAQPAPSAPAPSAPAPSARSLVSIDRATVEVKDLFRNAGADADVVLGPGPAPGGRIVVGAPQLAAIATQYGVAWQPGDQQPPVVIERPGIPLERDQITRALRPALIRAGAPRHFTITIDARNLPMVPPGSVADIAVNRLSLDRTTGNFRGSLLVKSATMAAVSIDVAGIATPAIRAVVAAENLNPGEILTGSNVKLGWTPSQTSPPHVLTALTQAIGMEVSRAVTSNTALSSRAVTAPLLIDRGAMVRLDVTMPGLEVSARGIAMAGGSEGSVIAVLNPTSREIVQAVVDGPDSAHVVPGSMPTRPRSMTPYYNIGSSPQ
jgi:flagella basal body P-ring formation protein FlgA